MSRSILLLAIAACGAAPPPPAEPPITTRTGGLEHGMANCPSALPTARTRVTDIPDGVAVTITVTEPADHAHLLRLAAVHARIGGPEGNAPEHSGMHGGPGDIGHCPILHTGTRVRFDRIEGGVRFEVRALPGGDVAMVRRETRERVTTLPRFSSY